MSFHAKVARNRMPASERLKSEEMRMANDVARAGFDARTRLLLEGPILSTLLRLATPNVLVMLVQA